MTKTRRIPESGIEVCGVGVCYLSACTALDDEAATEALNREQPTGLASEWRISEDAYFSDGKTANGSACPDRPGYRHILFEC